MYLISIVVNFFDSLVDGKLSQITCSACYFSFGEKLSTNTITNFEKKTLQILFITFTSLWRHEQQHGPSSFNALTHYSTKFLYMQNHDVVSQKSNFATVREYQMPPGLLMRAAVFVAPGSLDSRWTSGYITNRLQQLLLTVVWRRVWREVAEWCVMLTTLRCHAKLARTHRVEISFRTPSYIYILRSSTSYTPNRPKNCTNFMRINPQLFE